MLSADPDKQCVSLGFQTTFVATVNLKAKVNSDFQENQFVEHVKRMHRKRDKGFEEEFKVSEAQHEYIQCSDVQ